MYDLMCWCWSEKPQHRPTFEEILQILKTKSFTRLLSAMPVSKLNNVVSAACIYVSSTAPLANPQQFIYGSSATLHPSSSSSSVSSSPSPSLPADPSGVAAMADVATLLHSTVLGEETAVELWYGTQNGLVGMIQCNAHNITQKVGGAQW